MKTKKLRKVLHELSDICYDRSCEKCPFYNKMVAITSHCLFCQTDPYGYDVEEICKRYAAFKKEGNPNGLDNL